MMMFINNSTFLFLLLCLTGIIQATSASTNVKDEAKGKARAAMPPRSNKNQQLPGAKKGSRSDGRITVSSVKKNKGPPVTKVYDTLDELLREHSFEVSDDDDMKDFVVETMMGELQKDVKELEAMIKQVSTSMLRGSPR